MLALPRPRPRSRLADARAGPGEGGAPRDGGEDDELVPVHDAPVHWRGGQLGGRSFADGVAFNTRAFAEGFAVLLFFPASLPVVWALRGRTAMANLARARPRFDSVLHALMFALVVLVDVGFAVLNVDADVAGRGEVTFANSSYLAFVCMAACAFAYISHEDAHKLWTSPDAARECLATVELLARPSPDLIAHLVDRAQKLMGIDGGSMVLGVDEVTRRNVWLWAEVEGEGRDEGASERSSGKSVRPLAMAGNRATVSQTAQAVLNHAAHIQPYNARNNNILAILSTIAVAFSASLYRRLSSNHTLPFGSSLGGEIELGLIVLCFLLELFAISRIALALVGMSQLRRRTYGSVRDVLLIRAPKPGLSLDEATMESFLWLCKVLRRVGSLAHGQLDIIVTILVFIVVSTMAFFVATAFSDNQQAIQPNLASMGLYVAFLAVVLVRIIFVGADANVEHEVTRQVVLEIALHNNMPRAVLVSDVLTHMDEMESVSIVGVRCTKSLTKRVLVVLGSLVAVVVRFVFTDS